MHWNSKTPPNAPTMSTNPKLSSKSLSSEDCLSCDLSPRSLFVPILMHFSGTPQGTDSACVCLSAKMTATSNTQHTRRKTPIVGTLFVQSNHVTVTEVRLTKWWRENKNKKKSGGSLRFCQQPPTAEAPLPVALSCLAGTGRSNTRNPPQRQDD